MIFEIKTTHNELIEKNFPRIAEELSDFYETGLTGGLPKVFVMANRKTIDELRGKKSEPYQVGFCMGGNVYLLDRQSFPSESSHALPSVEKYIRILKHETSHLFFASLSNNAYKPRWLWEGVALFTDGSLRHELVKPKIFQEFLEFYKLTDKRIYYESGFAVEFLIEKYGKSLLLKMIKALSDTNSEKEFKKLFRRIYGFDLSYKAMNQAN